MAKQLVFGEEARRYLKSGVDAVANAVATTLGPRVATWLWIANMARPPSPTMVSPLPKRLNLKTPLRTWAPNCLKKQPPRPTTSLATAPPPQPFGTCHRDRGSQESCRGCKPPHAAQTRHRICHQGRLSSHPQTGNCHHNQRRNRRCGNCFSPGHANR